MFFIFAWCLRDEKSFSESVPLDLVGESYQAFASTVPIKVVFLEGYTLLSPSYLDKLKSLGLTLLDYSERFNEIVADFPEINARYSRYERNCFLRWVAFQEIYSALPGAPQVWHLDGDAILHTSTDDIARDTAGKTFVLQGCPVLVSIAEPRWFAIYMDELKRLESDVIGYSERAFAQKASIASRGHALCNVTLYRNPIGSDQDLMEYLISAGILMQESAQRIFNSKFYFIQNALVARYWDDLQANPKANGITRGDGGQLMYGSRTVPFVHYQNDFCYYCALYITLSKRGFERFMPDYINARNGGQGGERWLFTLFSRLMRKRGWLPPSRRAVIVETGRVHSRNSQPLIVSIINQLN